MKNLLLLSGILLLVSCSPRVSYLGDEYAPTMHVDIFFDPVDIEQDYKVMGLISANNSNNSLISLEDIKTKMIEEAKMKGADAILFNAVFSNASITDDQHIVEGKLLKYK